MERNEKITAAATAIIAVGSVTVFAITKIKRIRANNNVVELIDFDSETNTITITN